MIEICNTRSYRQYISLTILLLFAVSAAWLLFKKTTIWMSVGLFVILVLYILSENFTDTVCIEKNEMTIKYYKWGSKKSLIFELKNITAELETVVYKGRKSKRLSIYFNDELRYKIDEFSDEDLATIQQGILQHASNPPA
jgi:hypothetical protein